MNETTTGAPLTATVGERVGSDPHVREVQEQLERTAGQGARGRAEARPSSRSRPAGQAGRSFPWGALAVAAIGWALASAIGRRVRARGRRIGAAAAALARRVTPG